MPRAASMVWGESSIWKISDRIFRVVARVGGESNLNEESRLVNSGTSQIPRRYTPCAPPYFSYPFTRFYKNGAIEYSAASGIFWTPGTYASGAASAYWINQEANNAVAVYYYDESITKTAEVKSKAPNALGLYDMSGNVYEWCFNSIVNELNFYRAVRGGSWIDDASYLQVGDIYGFHPYETLDYLGFRPVIRKL